MSIVASIQFLGKHFVDDNIIGPHCRCLVTNRHYTYRKKGRSLAAPSLRALRLQQILIFSLTVFIKICGYNVYSGITPRRIIHMAYVYVLVGVDTSRSIRHCVGEVVFNILIKKFLWNL